MAVPDRGASVVIKEDMKIMFAQNLLGLQATQHPSTLRDSFAALWERIMAFETRFQKVCRRRTIAARPARLDR